MAVRAASKAASWEGLLVARVAPAAPVEPQEVQEALVAPVEQLAA
jgi:hypothetical protein